jgi:hypothetical protein
MNNHRHNGALFAIPFVLAAALPLALSGGAETIAPLPDLTTTAAGEPLLYLSTPDR